jgi:predicted small secreted protein
MRRFCGIVMLLAIVSACNTVEGVGQDITEAAQTVRDTF